MANIPLQDIEFPELGDTYTLTLVDNTLTQTGKAADAKATGDEISNLNNHLKSYGTTNDIPFTAGTSYPSTLTIVADKGKYTISGTISSYVYNSIFDNSSAFPTGVSAGDTLYFGVDAPTGVSLQVGQYVDGAWSAFLNIENGYRKVTISSSATGLVIRFKFLAGTYSSAVAYPYMFTTLSKQEIEDSFNVLNSELATTNTALNEIKGNMPTGEPKQFINPDSISVINARVNNADKLVADSNYSALIVPASIEANSQYRAKYLGNAVTFSEYRLYSFNTVNIGDAIVDKTDSYGTYFSRLNTTATASYFVLVMQISDGTSDDAIAGSVIAQATSYPSEYTPYYIPVDDAINNAIGKITSPNCIEVGTSSDDYVYTDVETAVQANANSIIKINYGTYETEVSDLTTDKKLIGTDRDLCILEKNGGSYDNPPIEIAGGIIKNLTVNMINDTEAEQYGYCVHSDNSATANKTLIISNCKFNNDLYRAIGMGVRGGEEVIFENCEFITHGTSTAQPIYIHNSSGDTATVRFRNCYFKSVNECMCLQGWGSDCSVDWEFINCTCVSETYGVTEDCVWTDYVSGSTHDTSRLHEFSGKFTLLQTSHGNNIAVLNA